MKSTATKVIATHITWHYFKVLCWVWISGASSFAKKKKILREEIHQFRNLL